MEFIRSMFGWSFYKSNLTEEKFSEFTWIKQANWTQKSWQLPIFKIVFHIFENKYANTGKIFSLFILFLPVQHSKFQKDTSYHNT